MNQNTAILKDLKRGRSVTPIVALRRYGCLRLAARVSDIRKQGYDIRREMVHKNGKTFAEYSL